MRHEGFSSQRALPADYLMTEAWHREPKEFLDSGAAGGVFKGIKGNLRSLRRVLTAPSALAREEFV